MQKMLFLQAVHTCTPCKNSILLGKTMQISLGLARLSPSSRLIGAGGKIPKGVFVAVAEVEPDGVRLDNGMRLKNQELLRATRPSRAASAWTWSPATSRCATCTWAPRGPRAPSCWRPRTGSTAAPGAPA